MAYLHWVLVLFIASTSINEGTRDQEKLTNQELLDRVSVRLLSAVEPVAGIEWPPKFEIISSNSLNAWSCDDGDDQHRAIRVTTALFDQIIQESPDRLALVLSHELAHVILDHRAVKSGGKQTVFKQLIFLREDEYAADLRGLELALATRYSYKKMLEAPERFIALKLDCAPIEGITYDHPCWTERMQRLDSARATLWKSMGNFNDGVFFLQLEQYAPAERCLNLVVRDFPNCPEAWTNLGYAHLMQYCDNLEPQDIREFDIGHLIVGGFYRRPFSLERTAVRGIDDELWYKAVGAFNEALRANPNLTLAKANLGLCYLLHPSGQKHVGEAYKYLSEAVSTAATDTTLDPIARLTILVNAGVAGMAAGHRDEFARELDSVSQLTGGIEQYSIGYRRFAAPILYNQAYLYSSSPKTDDKIKAISLLERYLRSTGRASLWWNIAYDQYVKLSKAVDRKPKEASIIQQESDVLYRQVLSVSLGNERNISLSDPLYNTQQQLGKCDALPIVPGTNLVELQYPDVGLRVIGVDRVLAIRLFGPKAPKISLRMAGPGQSTIGNLYVGMPVSELDKLLGVDRYEGAVVLDPKIHYQFYRQVGVAIREEKGQVVELVVTRLPDVEDQIRLPH